MMRFLDATGDQHLRYAGPAELLEAIRLSEGRTLLCEVVVTGPPLVDGVSNPELAAAFGADLLLLNFYDVIQPQIAGLPGGLGRTAGDVRRLTGRPVGINLEPSEAVPPGRRATVANARLAAEQGVDLVVITGNPGTGVSNEGVLAAARAIRDDQGQRLVVAAGRMHAAGLTGQAGAGLVDVHAVEAMAEVADIILLPAPGTVPGVTPERAAEWVEAVHQAGRLAMTTVGTSQEGADEATLRQIALWAKTAGADIHHLGDAGLCGVAVPENIMAYSIAIRGRRHTFRRMAASILPRGETERGPGPG